jgi:CheY-like chemotaxis protein
MNSTDAHTAIATAKMNRPEATLEAAITHLTLYRREASEAQAQLNLELRTGLTSILGFAELLSAEIPPAGRESVSQIIKAGRELLTLIDQHLRPNAEAGKAEAPESPSALKLPNRHDRTILYVEDNDANFALIDQIVASISDLELLRAEGGQAALTVARQNRPDLILLDLDLPDMHGSEVLRHLREHTITADIPVVIISADETPSQIERLLTAGARNYLTKPISVETFVAVVSELLQRESRP